MGDDGLFVTLSRTGKFRLRQRMGIVSQNEQQNGVIQCCTLEFHLLKQDIFPTAGNHVPKHLGIMFPNTGNIVPKLLGISASVV